ncbi:hypothetical protein [Bifidobacterium biavatii]|uniref:Cobalt transporter n=1 Tax=Bifidobacterium biavatii DSM 23969 TaxID=1437608 RepID=A0A086ZHV4_9BIFI|nr:hypothetical protein [Bifidobacterium biavatii]KFI46104.1 cobalt transporter [Bifidobacterium biavatii DSM 23969]
MKDRKGLIIMVVAGLVAVALIVFSTVAAARRADERERQAATSSVQGTTSTKEAKPKPQSSATPSDGSKDEPSGQETTADLPGLNVNVDQVCAELAPQAVDRYLDKTAKLDGWFDSDADGLQWRDRIIEQPNVTATGFLVTQDQSTNTIVCNVSKGLAWPWILTYHKDPKQGWVVSKIEPPAEGAFSESKGTGPQTAGVAQ